jgi:hypothetical protein
MLLQDVARTFLLSIRRHSRFHLRFAKTSHFSVKFTTFVDVEIAPSTGSRVLESVQYGVWTNTNCSSVLCRQLRVTTPASGSRKYIRESSRTYDVMTTTAQRCAVGHYSYIHSETLYFDTPTSQREKCP